MTEDDKLTANGKLDVVDPDKGEAVFKPQTDIAGTYGKFSIDANGNWKYELNNSDPKVQALGAGEKLTETFTVTTADGTTGTVTITVNGTNDKPTIGGVATGDVKEDGTQEVSGQLTKTDVDVNDKHTWSVNDNGKGQYGTFSVDTNGKWTYKLDNDSAQVQALKEGQKVTDTITVTVDDGHGGTATQVVTVTITGTNDAAVITPSKPGDDAGSVTEDDKLTTGGKLDVTDKDAGEASFKPQTDFKGDHGKFSIDANGNWKYELDNADPKVQALGVGEKLVETFEVVTADGTKGTVTVTINGTNDAPTIGGVAAGAVKEDGTTTVSGQLTKSDVDTNDTHTWSIANNGNGQYGKFTVDQTGKWTYVLDNKSAQVQALAEGQKVTDTIVITVDDGKGGKATQTVTVEVTGTNDAPTIGGTATGAVKEDAVVNTTSGQLTKTDVDTNDVHTWSVANNGNGQYGKFTVDQTGKWTYTLDNSNAKVQALAEGQTATDTIIVTVNDGKGGTATQEITVTITGTNDAPTIGGVATGAVTEDAAVTIVTGQLTKTDVDATDTHTWSIANNGNGQYGKFTLDQTGKWTYVLDNGSTKVQSLAAGQTVTDTITVTISDGKGGTATKDITITITGANDNPTIGGVATGAVKEDGTLTTAGQLTKSDIDTNDTHTWSIANSGNGQYGKFTLDQTGKWTYTLDNASAKVQALTEGQTVTDTITVTVNDGKGGTATQEITVTITGTNDVAKITGQSTGAVIEDNTLLSSGKLTVSDADAGQSSVVAQTNAAGKYGTFSIDANGNWTYSLNNSSQVVQDLKPGQVVKETFEVVSADGSAKQTITIDVVGTNDARWPLTMPPAWTWAPATPSTSPNSTSAMAPKATTCRA